MSDSPNTQTTLRGPRVDERELESTMRPSSLPDAEHKDVATALSSLVGKSAEHGDVEHSIHAHTSSLHGIPWIHKLVPGLQILESKYHVGNFVRIRGSDEKFFESMPIYARIGMHLLFYGKKQLEALQTQTVEQLLRSQSIKQGKIYDDPESVKSIASFAKLYEIQTDDLLVPDLSAYKTFNEFFYRKLKDGARPVQNADDPAAFCSAADSRLTVYQTVNLAKEFWIKGRRFSVPLLLDVTPDSPTALQFDGASLAIFRLAPADYHRFHSPLDGTVTGEVHNVPGQYYTVNPQAVNEPDFDVFTANTRSVMYFKHTATGLPFAFVAIGALLVGSINWSVQPGQEVKRGDELGYFAYGGSTVVAVFPKGLIEFDEDLVVNSKLPIETLVKVGYSLGKTPAQDNPAAGA
ncbi:hypothetical protein PLICRDRAFT_55231 [Plicaturopsis crispa FD-325 SS-3]|nr:hypothetical protein PLICRDRAFT_55231 [Plicaturopsis crispa FD-325 SS-3]